MTNLSLLEDQLIFFATQQSLLLLMRLPYVVSLWEDSHGGSGCDTLWGQDRYLEVFIGFHYTKKIAAALPATKSHERRTTADRAC